MTALSPYLTFPGTAAEALHFYRGVFGGEVKVHTFADFGRDDGVPDAIAHGEMRGPVPIFASDAGTGVQSVRVEGLLFALLGAGDAATSRGRFEALSQGGTVVSPLEQRPWGDSDGQVRDRYGITWLIGFTPQAD